jgi:hypothetical protein
MPERGKYDFIIFELNYCFTYLGILLYSTKVYAINTYRGIRGVAPLTFCPSRVSG